MAKNNKDFLARQQAKKAAEIKMHRLFTMQWCADAAILAANEVFQRKGKKIVEFNNAFTKYAHEIAKMTISDAKDDRDIEYTKGTVDAKLEDILGEDFVPWEVRYDFWRE